MLWDVNKCLCKFEIKPELGLKSLARFFPKLLKYRLKSDDNVLFK